eukprot:Nitzschia sp. Nitz4//scaffold17_size182527//134562//135215//NITZ4_001873-RA/size182527-processed-gene-0.105-mRNA-1//1//CDS//3329539397//5738//frame0
MSVPSKLKLYYFNFAAKGEPIRLLCAYAGIEFEDYRFENRPEMHAMRDRGELPFGQVPLLEIDGKHKLAQTPAILMYLYRLSGMAPSDPLVCAQIEALLAADTDAFIPVAVSQFPERFGIDLQGEAKTRSDATIANEIFPKHLGRIEQLLEKSPTGWLAGTEQPSPADWMWFARLAFFIPTKPEFPEKLQKLEDFPACRSFVDRVYDLDPIKKYYNK